MRNRVYSRFGRLKGRGKLINIKGLKVFVQCLNNLLIGEVADIRTAGKKPSAFQAFIFVYYGRLKLDALECK